MQIKMPHVNAQMSQNIRTGLLVNQVAGIWWNPWHLQSLKRPAGCKTSLNARKSMKTQKNISHFSEILVNTFNYSSTWHFMNTVKKKKKKGGHVHLCYTVYGKGLIHDHLNGTVFLWVLLISRGEYQRCVLQQVWSAATPKHGFLYLKVLMLRYSSTLLKTK